jgi:hypothetical protein
MNTRLREIKLRKQLLVSRAAAQRGEIAAIAEMWRGPLQLAENAMAVVRALRLHPAVTMLIESLLVAAAFRHHGTLLKWSGRSFVGWEMYRAVREVWPRQRRPIKSVQGERID